MSQEPSRLALLCWTAARSSRPRRLRVGMGCLVSEVYEDGSMRLIGEGVFYGPAGD
jgi:hypothetical protein